MCDAISYAQDRFNPNEIIDLATLTSAVVVALGSEYAGIFANDDALAARLLAAGEATGEKLWRLPLSPRYNEQLRSDIADMKNVAGKDASASIASHFIGRFIIDRVAWAHLDISGTAWSELDRPDGPKGATGYGVRLLYEYITRFREQSQLSASADGVANRSK
jgi:leucyl aminopeptidase